MRENSDGMDHGSTRYGVLEYIPGGVCVLRRDQTVAFWSRQLGAWTGVHPREIEDRALADFFPRCATPPFRDHIKPVFLQGETVVLSRAQGQIPFAGASAGANGCPDSVSVSPMPGESRGEMLALFTFGGTGGDGAAQQPPRESDALPELLKRCRELEEEKAQILDHMRQMQRLERLGVVAGGIAHDFNNLLSVIMGNTDVIAVSASGQQLLNHCCGQIQEAARRASGLVAQILAYSGGGQFVLDAINLSDLVHSHRKLIEATVPRNVKLSCELAAELAEVSGDAEQFQQVITNLVGGALDAIGSGPGTIGIETGMVTATDRYLASLYPKDTLSPGEMAYLEIRDNGAGLEQALIDNLFETGNISDLGDRGLGLAASLGVVRAHNGGLRVWSAAGGGTAVRIHFPALPDEQESYTDGQRVGGLLDARPGRGRILLVDDEEMVRALGEIILEQNGFTVLTAADGDDAITTFEAHEEDLSLVLLDMSMPKRDGYEVARLMRAIRADIPIVICSGYPGVDARNRFAELQVDGFLQKPYHINDLLELVEQVLG